MKILDENPQVDVTIIHPEDIMENNSLFLRYIKHVPVEVQQELMCSKHKLATENVFSYYWNIIWKVKLGCNILKKLKSDYCKSFFKNLKYMNNLNRCEIPGRPPHKIYNYSQSGGNIYQCNIKMSRVQGLNNKS